MTSLKKITSENVRLIARFIKDNNLYTIKNTKRYFPYIKRKIIDCPYMPLTELFKELLYDANFLFEDVTKWVLKFQKFIIFERLYNENIIKRNENDDTINYQELLYNITICVLNELSKKTKETDFVIDLIKNDMNFRDKFKFKLTINTISPTVSMFMNEHTYFCGNYEKTKIICMKINNKLRQIINGEIDITTYAKSYFKLNNKL